MPFFDTLKFYNTTQKVVIYETKDSFYKGKRR